MRFGGIRNLDGFGERKKWTENLIKSEIGRSRVTKIILWTGPAECADAAEALESVSSRVMIRHASSPERGWRTHSRTP